jgi:hypothetical protein
MSQQSSVPIRTSTNIQTAIGRRLYPDAHTAVVELVSNSYDADADNVNILVTPTKIVACDDGWGMTEEALGSFFTIGKSSKPPSQKEREPIGAFGIGKFAILSMADEFAVFTKASNGYRARASYSHQDALAAGEYLSDYQVPIEVFETEEEYRLALVDEMGTDEYYDVNKNGVTIIMHHLHRQYSDLVIKQRLSEMLVPQAKKSFQVYVNGEILEERYIHGLRYTINLITSYGPITGEIIIAAESIELGQQAGVQAQVQSRGLYRTYFGLYDYDRAAKRLSGYAMANWLNGVIASNRTELINSPEKTAFEEAMATAIRSILDQEALKRTVEDEEKKKQILDRAVRTVTRVLNQLPELDFPRRPLHSMIPIGVLDNVLAGKDPAADIEPTGSMDAVVTASRGNRMFSELLDYLRQIAPQYHVDVSNVPTEVRTISEALDVIEKVLGVSIKDLIGAESFQQLLGAIPEAALEEPEQLEGALRLAERRLTDIVKKVTTSTLEDLPTQNAQLVGGVTLRTPITNALELTKINLIPIAPPLDTATLDLKVDPLEEGFVPDAPQAQINNFIAASIEHLGENGPASMTAEGFSFDGIQIYINADHMVYQSIQSDSPNMLAFYQAQLIFNEVVLLQNFTPREAIEKQGELMRLLIQADRKILRQ